MEGQEQFFNKQYSEEFKKNFSEAMREIDINIDNLIMGVGSAKSALDAGFDVGKIVHYVVINTEPSSEQIIDAFLNNKTNDILKKAKINVTFKKLYEDYLKQSEKQQLNIDDTPRPKVK